MTRGRGDPPLRITHPEGRSRNPWCPVGRKGGVNAADRSPVHRLRPESYREVRLRSDRRAMGRAYRRDVFGRLRAWDGRHPVLVDLLRMSPFLILIGLSILAYLTFPGANGSWSHILLSVLLALPLPFARRHPRTGFAIVAAISGLQWLTMGEVLMANISVVILMYQVASHRPLRWAVAAGLITVLGLMLITRWPQDLGDG